jgi:anti-sigma28 factor (negative regulator of flagellin synthesis)
MTIPTSRFNGDFMRINPKNPAEPAARVARETSDPSAGTDPRRRGQGAIPRDSVQISDAGRAKAAGVTTSLSPDRVHDIRQRILNGEYDTVEVLGSTARRILSRGDA